MGFLPAHRLIHFFTCWLKPDIAAYPEFISKVCGGSMHCKKSKYQNITGIKVVVSHLPPNLSVISYGSELNHPSLIHVPVNINASVCVS